MEVLREDVTPVGLHYLLVHYDIPAVDPGTWRLRVEGLRDRGIGISSFAAAGFDWVMALWSRSTSLPGWGHTIFECPLPAYGP